MSTFFKDLNQQGPAKVHNDDVLPMSHFKPQTQQLQEEPLDNAKKERVKTAPEKPCFMLFKAQYFGYEFIFIKSKFIQSETAAIEKHLSRTTEFFLMTFIGSMNFSTKITDNLHVEGKPLQDLFHDIVKPHWKYELESLFQRIETSFKTDKTLILPKKTINSVFCRVF